MSAWGQRKSSAELRLASSGPERPWRGLDRDDLPVERKVCLAIKFALVSMLRSVEMLHIHRREFDGHDLNSAFPLVVIPEERVKAGREIHQPLSDLAVEIAKEAMGNYPYLFIGRYRTEPVDRKAMAAAKVQIGRSGRFVGQQAIQLHGGIGMTMEYKVGHYFKRVTTIDTLFGDADHHLAELARLGGLIAAPKLSREDQDRICDEVVASLRPH